MATDSDKLFEELDHREADGIEVSPAMEPKR